MCSVQPFYVLRSLHLRESLLRRPPYYDVENHHTRPEAPTVIPWFRRTFICDGQSVCKDRSRTRTQLRQGFVGQAEEDWAGKRLLRRDMRSLCRNGSPHHEYQDGEHETNHCKDQECIEIRKCRSLLLTQIFE